MGRRLPTAGDVEEAARRIADIVVRTPAVRTPALDACAGHTVYCKAECLQPTGSFKLRGAANRLLLLTSEERGRGVLAWSSGNHAQAVAYVAARIGVKATILMPTDAPPVKRAATQALGAAVVTYDRYTQDRAVLAEELSASTGAVMVPAYDDPDVIAGQGTAALELLADVGPLDVLVVPMSGGGLMAGCALVARHRCPDMRLVGVEPAAGDDWVRSHTARERVRIPVPRTIADGQQVEIPGELPWAVLQDKLDAVVTVSDGEIVGAMRVLADRARILSEPSGASAMAAVVTRRVGAAAGDRVGVIVSGGNVGVDRFCELVFAPPGAS